MSYNFQATLRMRGALDVDVLARSLAEIVRRHEILRTTFPEVDGRPAQRIHDPWPVRLPLVDMEALPEYDREAAAQRFIEEEFRQPFDLTRLPLVRWKLIRLHAREHILVHVEHHLIHDGWSFNVLLGELVTLYTAFSAGEPSPLPALPIQFADFACWQREWLQSGTADAQLAYWKEKLVGSPPLLELPTDRPRPPVQSYKGAAPRVELPLHLCEALRAFSRHEGVTLFMTFLAALQTLLHRYTGQDDFCIGTGIANRRWHQTEGLIGMIINTVALRSDLSGNPTFRELLGRVREVTLEAYAHQDVPFDMVVDAVQPNRDLSYNPLFQVMLGFHDAPLPTLELPGLQIELMEGLSNGSAKFDMNITAIPHAEQHIGGRSGNGVEGITLIWEYNTDLFDALTIECMIGHFQTLLEDSVAHLERHLSDLSLLTETERQLLMRWSADPVETARDGCLPALFEVQVEQTPDAVAVVFEEHQLTYRELNWRANQLAHYLQRLRVGPEVLVGLCVERSLEMVVAILGILKAGGAYVPLDPTYPKERLAFMLADAGVPVLLTQQHLVAGLPPCAAIIVCIDTEWEIIARESGETPDTCLSGQNLAYTIYTSGSTGRPKGTQITHHSLVNCLSFFGERLGLDRQDVFVAITTLSFDIAALELFLPLLVGARVVLTSREVAKDGVQLQCLLASSEATILQATPTTWNLLLATGWAGSPRLKLLCGGEALSPELANLLCSRGANVWNVYGPTETTIWSAIHPVAAGSRSVPIGRPIANTQFYVLDSQLQSVPMGVPGELYIGGDGLARGYFHHPDLTAERFVPSPFGSQPGARLYKTGDLVRYRRDGTIEFLGRLDHQIKLRGFRIELGEIEARLGEHAGVREVVVLARVETPGSKRLVAYVVPAEIPGPTAGELHDYLKTCLPDYMVPEAFVLLEALPLTPNGKVDRRALPAPTWPELAESFMAPRTPTEEVLARIWAEVLGLERVGVQDNFFALGGHSLAAIQILSRVREAFQVELPLRSLFKGPIVAELAVAIEKAKK
jgi:amino acid adenylation domain-containing protein